MSPPTLTCYYCPAKEHPELGYEAGWVPIAAEESLDLLGYACPECAYFELFLESKHVDPIMNHPMINAAEAITKRWMAGHREGPKGQKPRMAWEHPADLVRLLGERPGEFSEAGQIQAMTIAWLHDLIEDGRKENGTRVTIEDLAKVPRQPTDPLAPHFGVFSETVLESVVQLTHVHGTTKIDYYRQLQDIPMIPKLVKCVDRICNLREGRATFKQLRWERYVSETEQYILPLAQALREETAEWLTRLLRNAMALPASP